MKLSHYSFALTQPVVWGGACEFTLTDKPGVTINVARIRTNAFERGLFVVDSFLVNGISILIGGNEDLNVFYKDPPTPEETKALNRVVEAERRLDNHLLERENSAFPDGLAKELEAAELAYDPFRKPEIRFGIVVRPTDSLVVHGRYTGALPTKCPEGHTQESLAKGKDYLLTILLSGAAMDNRRE